MERIFQSIVFVGALSIAQLGHGGIIGGPEVEPNDSMETAHVLGSLGADDFTFVNGSLQPGDIDFFAVDLTPHVILYLSMGSIGLNNPNVLLAMFDTSGVLLETSLEYPVKFGPPVLIGDVPRSGRYYVAVTGITDVLFVGHHEFSFEYGLNIETLSVPAPSMLVIIFTLAAGNGRTRRR